MNLKSITITAFFLFSINCLFSQTKTISSSELEDKIYASWLGQIIGNIYGLPHENLYVDNPGPENYPYGYGWGMNHMKEVNGAFSDDDTDIEYIYLMMMEKFGTEPTYRDLAEAWKYHIRGSVWIANRTALGLMHYGMTPPATGMKEHNPHWFQIDPQLINEIWAVTAPGMIDYAASKSEWGAKICADDWGTEPTVFYGALYSAAFFEKDINKLIDIALNYLPENGRFRKAVADMRQLYKQYPKDLKKARAEMAKMYYYDEPEETRTKWNAILNGACAVLALLYGEGDFQKTLDYGCYIGFDADNQTATICGLLGIINGTKGLPKDLLYPIKEWKLPFNDLYKNRTRYDMPDAKITDMAKRTKAIAEKIIIENGGSKRGNKYIINTAARFQPPLEFVEVPTPIIHVNEKVDYKILLSGETKDTKWELTGGKLPEGLSFSNGIISGIPSQTGHYSINVTVVTLQGSLSHDVKLMVRPDNLAFSAKEVIANVPVTNIEIRDAMAFSYKSMYADNVEVIRDGKYNGNRSVFLSILNRDKNPKIDFYGYKWDNVQTIGSMGLFVGPVEVNGGWFSSINVQYLDENNSWRNVNKAVVSPRLPHPTDEYQQPHMVEYFISFEPVKTKGIRLIGDATLLNHWEETSASVSPFTSITELSVYNPF